MKKLNTLKDIEIKGQNIPTWVLQLVAKEWIKKLEKEGLKSTGLGLKDADKWEYATFEYNSNYPIIDWIRTFFNLD